MDSDDPNSQLGGHVLEIARRLRAIRGLSATQEQASMIEAALEAAQLIESGDWERRNETLTPAV